MSDEQRVQFFVNGTGMREGDLHAGLGDAEFVGDATTTPDYRFFAYNGEFPGLSRVESGGKSIAGEVYSVRMQQLLETFLPSEPAQLELSVISLGGGHHVLGMVVRVGEEDLPAWEDISAFGGWRSFKAAADQS